METDWWIDHGPYSEFGDLLTIASGAVHRRRLRHREHPRPGQARLPPTTPGVRRSAPTARRRRSWPRKSPWTCWPRRWAMDPFEFRYKNLYNANSTTPTGQKPDVLVLEQAASTCCGRSSKRPRSAARNSQRPGRRSAASASRSASTAAASTGRTAPRRRVELTPTGVTVYNAWQDHGQGADLGTLTMAHEVLRAARLQARADQAGDERHRRCRTPVRPAAAARTSSSATPPGSLRKCCSTP